MGIEKLYINAANIANVSMYSKKRSREMYNSKSTHKPTKNQLITSNTATWRSIKQRHRTSTVAESCHSNKETQLRSHNRPAVSLADSQTSPHHCTNAHAPMTNQVSEMMPAIISCSYDSHRSTWAHREMVCAIGTVNGEGQQTIAVTTSGIYAYG